MSLNGNVIDIGRYLARPNLADGLNREELAALLEEVKALEGRVMARLLLGATEQPAAAPVAQPQASVGPGGDRMLTTKEAAAILRRAPSWIYRHSDLPFVEKRNSPRERILCSEQRLWRYLARR